MTCPRMCRFPDGHSFGEFPKDGLCGAMLFVGAPRVLLVDGRAVMLEDGAPRFAFFQFSFFSEQEPCGCASRVFLDVSSCAHIGRRPAGTGRHARVSLFLASQSESPRPDG